MIPVLGHHILRHVRHKAMIQCARLAFGFVGIYDEDEGERIIQGDATIVRSEAIDELNAEVKPKEPAPVPTTVIISGATHMSGSGGGSASVHDTDAPPLNLTGGPNLTDVISALRAAKTIEDVDAAEDLARHMRLDAKQREEVKAEAQGAAKRIDKP